MPATTKFATNQLRSHYPMVRDVVEEAGPEYSDAVVRCLHHIPQSHGVEERMADGGGYVFVEMVSRSIDGLRRGTNDKY
jgi:hypothetical protein